MPATKILYMTQYYYAPWQTGSGRPWFNAHHLADFGFEVTVVTSDTDYFTGRRVKSVAQPNGDNVKVILVHPLLFGKSILARLGQYLSYACYAFWRALFQSPDVVFATSPPLFVGLAGLILARLKRALFIFEVRDPWPDAIVHLGALSSSFPIRLLYRLEGYLYKHADLIIALTPGIKRLLLAKGVDEQKIIVVTNGFDAELFKETTSGTAGGRTRVVYAGSHGPHDEVSHILDAVRLVKHKTNIDFIFVGNGPLKQELAGRAKKDGLERVIFMDPVPRKEIPAILGKADIGVLACPPGLYAEIGLYNKLFDYMAAGLAVVAAAKGDIAEVLRLSQGGIAVEPGNAQELAAALLRLVEDGPLARRMGKAGAEYVRAHFDRKKLAESLARAIAELAAKKTL